MVTKFERRGHWRTNINGTRFYVRPHEVEKEFYTITSPDGYLLVNGKSRLSPHNCRHCGSKVFYASLSPTKNIYFNSDREPLIKHQCLKPSANKVQHNGPLKKPKKFFSDSEIRAQEQRKEIDLQKKVLMVLGGSWKIKNFHGVDLDRISKLASLITSSRRKVDTLTLRKNSLEKLIKRQKQKQKKNKKVELKDPYQERNLFRAIDELSLEKKEIDKNFKDLKKAIGKNLIRSNVDQKTLPETKEKQKNKIEKVKFSVVDSDALLKKSLKKINNEINQMESKIKDELDNQKLIPLLIHTKKLKIRHFDLKINIEKLRSRNSNINSKGRKQIKEKIVQFSTEQKKLLASIQDLKDPKSEHVSQPSSKNKKETPKLSEIEAKMSLERISTIDEEIKTILSRVNLDSIDELEKDNLILKLENLRLEKLKLRRDINGGMSLHDSIRKKAALIVNLSRKVEEGLKMSPSERIKNEIKKAKISVRNLRSKKQNNKLIKLIDQKLIEIKELENKLEVKRNN